MFGQAQQKGARAEARAERYLQEQGLSPVARNYRCRGGEIDLVMRHGATLVFIEVRLRRNTAFGGALASVDRHKQQRLQLAAQHYLQRHRWQGPCRFDVVGLEGEGPPQWVRNAFDGT